MSIESISEGTELSLDLSDEEVERRVQAILDENPEWDSHVPQKRSCNDLRALLPFLLNKQQQRIAAKERAHMQLASQRFYDPSPLPLQEQALSAIDQSKIDTLTAQMRKARMEEHLIKEKIEQYKKILLGRT